MVYQVSPIERKPAYLQVFESIENEILAGRLNDGDPIPTEKELCERFNVQRSTVREGIRLLEQSGLVRRLNGKRLLISRPRAEDAAESTRRGLERHGVRFIDVWESSVTLLIPAGQLAARKASADDIQRLQEVTEQLANTTDREQIVTAAVRYLEVISEATGNSVIAIMMRSLLLLTRSSLETVIDYLPTAQQRIAEAQTEITQAIKDGDMERASAWMQRHTDDLLRGYEAAGIDVKTEVGLLDRS